MQEQKRANDPWTFSEVFLPNTPEGREVFVILFLTLTNATLATLVYLLASKT